MTPDERRRLRDLLNRFAADVERLSTDNPGILDTVARSLERAVEGFTRRVN